jgi:translation initiation factor 1 (eIF-1/SUI1)
MDLLTFNNEHEPNRIDNIDSKIDIKYIKVKKHLRTYISGLHYFMKDEEIRNFVLLLKKKLGAGMEVKESEIGIEYGFQGDHKDRIKELIIESKKVKKEDIA